MCIYGVTRIGTGSLGPSRFLPTLVTVLQATKPALVFLSGAWFVLHTLNRRTRTASLTGRVLVLLVLAGSLAVADAAVETAYLVIPKKEVSCLLGAAPWCSMRWGGADGFSRAPSWAKTQARC